ncbi:CopD family protein [Roseobacter sp. HKCCA0434]|uniref:CopD family protein n=1 Tax=Roseobacter sp. HKCCA0434 TaxID=3079297 RepID=UPI002905D629|nr:CopD family protein [Roseobacter sp. HKCCA0434]
MGGPLFLTALPQTNDDLRRRVRKIAVIAAMTGLAVLAMRFGIRAARISGMGLQGAVDPMMLGFVWESPLGTAALWRSAGELLVLALLVEGTVGLALGLVGALFVAVSYTLVGHSLGDPRWLLSAMLVLHLLSAAFWVGALAPLYHATDAPGGARLLHRFGVIASGTVALLIGVGTVFAWLMSGSVSALLYTAYGRILLAKVAVVACLLGLAALNKLRLVPALARNEPAASIALKRSIRLETVAVALILIATATLTTVTTPSVNL